MGQTPTFNDRFAPRGAATKDGPGRDRFAAQAGRAGTTDHFGDVKLAIRGDAFAGGGRTGKPVPVDRFGAKPVPAESRPPAPVATIARSPQVKRTPLVVVASHEEAVSPLMVRREAEALPRRAARTSSLVLVSGVAMAADVIDAPPPAPAPKIAETPPPPPLLAERSVTRSGGGGGGGGAGSGEPPRERGFNQDDFVGVMLGAAVVVLLLLWLMRGGQQPDNQIAGVQSAMNNPIAVPAAAPTPPPLPPPDPFGDRAVDLTPKGPIPEAAPDTSNAVVATAPASPVPIGDRSMHAWFCTAGSKLTVASRKALEGELEQFSAAFAGKDLVVRGYADTRGTSDFNSALGGERAKVVADFLRTKGLNIVDAAGVGELTGLDDNQNCSNQRRVDVFVKGGPGEAPSRACAPEPDVQELVCG